MTLEITQLDANQSDFDQRLDSLLAWESVSDHGVQTAVAEIVADVRQRGDQAVLDYTKRFDRLEVGSLAELVVPAERLQQALNTIPEDQRNALQVAADRVRTYHERQKQDSWSYTEADGTLLGQQVTPLDRAGLYVPGGKASYPSSVLMNAIPAKAAGVKEAVAV